MHQLKPDFFYKLVAQSSGDQTFQLERSHSYYCQVQGQMAITERPWCDYIVYTSNGIANDRITFDKLFWESELLPKLGDFLTIV